MKIAVISDIHGNLPALEAVLADIAVFGADQVYCLGDLTDAAPWHNEVIALIRHRHIPVIMGNHDERIAFDLPVIPLPKHGPEEQDARDTAINFTKATITPDNRHFLSCLPDSLRIEFPHLSLLLTHGSTRSNDEYIYEDHPEEDIVNMLTAANADVLFTGHTHFSYIRSVDSGARRIINAGAVGRTREEKGKAVYLQLEIKNRNATTLDELLDVRICKIDYEVERTLEAIRRSPIPDFYARFLAPETAY